MLESLALLGRLFAIDRLEEGRTLRERKFTGKKWARSGSTNEYQSWKKEEIKCLKREKDLRERERVDRAKKGKKKCENSDGAKKVQRGIVGV